MTAPQDVGTGQPQQNRPEINEMYRVAPVGGNGSYISFREPGEFAVFGSDPRCNFIFNKPTDGDISRVMGMVYMGNRYPVVIDCSKNGLYVPSSRLARAIRDEPSFMKELQGFYRMFNAGIVGKGMMPQVQELLFGRPPTAAGAFEWEYRRVPNDPVGNFMTENGSAKKFQREKIAMYNLESMFCEPDRKSVELVLATPKNPSRKIQITRIGEH